MTKEEPLEEKPYDIYILIDTNIFFDNFHLEGNKFLALDNLLKKTHSRILMPSIVVDEVKKKYTEYLSEQQRKIDRINERFPEMLTQNKTMQELQEEYVTFWNSQLKKMDLIDSSKVDLSRLIERSLLEHHPFAKESKGFRDALIWESVLLYLKSKAKNNDTPLVVVTKNVKDFGDGCLFDDLQGELGERSSFCYSDFGQFLNEHEGRIDFITDGYIEKYVEETPEEIDYIASNIGENELIEKFRENEYSMSISNLSVDDGPSATGYWEVGSYYIYKEDDENYYIEIELTVEVEYSVHYCRETVHYDTEGYPEPDYENDRAYSSGYFYGIIACKINKKTQEIEPE